ncbi:MAG: hypothetical protein EON95_14240 [Caulobacteraceae bacterium]|nr:MAG: hypothetical protein EON95_14240 [Caulobacteraceae bacterium]
MPPTLAPPAGQLPTLSVQRSNDGSFGIPFILPINSGPIGGVVMLPNGGWDNGAGQVGFMRQNSNQIESGGVGPFKKMQSQYGPMRAMQPQWQQDNVGFGQICIAFIGPQGQQDVPLQGSTLCVMDGACQQASACGKVG